MTQETPTNQVDVEASSPEEMHNSISKLNNPASSEENTESTCSKDNDDGSVVSDISGFSNNEPDFLRDFDKKPEEKPHLNSARKSGNTVLKSAMKKMKKVQENDDQMFVFDFHVSFKTIKIRQYERILSDNPASSSGPSIGIGWEYTEEETFEVDEYEQSRDDIICKDLADLALSPRRRILMLRDLGYSDDEIEQGMKEINECKERRNQTAANNIGQKTIEGLVSAKIGIKKVFKRGMTVFPTKLVPGLRSKTASTA